MKPMNIDEIKEWLKDKHPIDEGLEYDDMNNKLYWKVYAVDGDYFMLNWSNGTLSEDFGEKGYIKNQYTPRKVTKHVIETIVWE